MYNFFDHLAWHEYQRKQDAVNSALERPEDGEYDDIEKPNE